MRQLHDLELRDAHAHHVALGDVTRSIGSPAEQRLRQVGRPASPRATAKSPYAAMKLALDLTREAAGSRRCGP